ncbi:hypothetical protein CTI14_01375 [Methylobacterium radiotolerans]|nr:hypothetical protein CTI14_01375 [Methylobacterium radiotolerans]
MGNGLRQRPYHQLRAPWRGRHGDRDPAPCARGLRPYGDRGQLVAWGEVHHDRSWHPRQQPGRLRHGNRYANPREPDRRHRSPADGDGIVIQNFTDTVDVKITGNTFRRCRKRAIKIQCSGVIAEGNRIFNAYDATQSAQPYSGISVYAGNCRVQQNTVEGVWTVACIELGATSVPISDTSVCDNTIICDIPNRQPSGDGISFDVATPSITRCHISRNTVVGVRHGVRLQNVIDQTEAIGNHFTSLTGSAYVVDDNNGGHSGAGACWRWEHQECGELLRDDRWWGGAGCSRHRPDHRFRRFRCTHD